MFAEKMIVVWRNDKVRSMTQFHDILKLKLRFLPRLQAEFVEISWKRKF